MTNFARIVDGVAVDVSTDPVKQFHPTIAAEFVSVPDTVKRLWRVQGGVWSAPPPAPTSAPTEAPAPPPALTWDNAPAEYFQIDVGPFFDRFGQKALQVTSSTDPVVEGMVKFVTPRKFIDLKRPDLSSIIGILVTKGIITSEERDAVLVQRTTDYERHSKGLPQPADTV
jgi:hypothetical protein